MTIKELAQLAGVSPSTVSKIMNQKDDSISAETREHVMKLAKEYHYTPYATVTLKHTRSLTLGVLLRSAPETDLTFSGILSAAHQRGYTILLRTSENSPEAEQKNIHAFISLQIDGLIWEPVGPQSAALAPELEHAEIPYLFMTSPVVSDSGPVTGPDIQNTIFPGLQDNSTQDIPTLDYAGMGYQLTEALVKKGHIEIACLLMDGVRTPLFYEGYRRCLFDHQIPFHEDLVFRLEEGLPVSKIAGHLFSGIVVSHYAAALKLYEAVVDSLHYSIPYDLSVASLRNDARLPADYPPLSTLTIPHIPYGGQLCNYLIDLIEKKKIYKGREISFSLENERSIDVPFNSRLKRILSIGCINIDNYLNMEKLPRPGKTVTVPAASMYLGGRCANEAIGVARLGHTVSMIGRVGHGAHADFVYTSIGKEAIDGHAVRRTQKANTGQAFVFVQRDGESIISVSAGANDFLTRQDILDHERLFHNASCCLLQTGIPMDVTITAARTAKKHGLFTVLKPSSCSTLPGELLKLIDLIIPNAEEMDEICHGLCPGLSSLEEKTDFLLSCGAGTVIVTLSTQGCYIKSKEGEFRIPAVPFPTIDNSGASDAFISALVSYLLYGYDLYTSARIASYAAGFSTTRQGVSPSLIDRDTLEAYIQQKEPDLLLQAKNVKINA